MAYIQKILITILLLLAIADGCKGNASQPGGSCCQAPGGNASQPGGSCCQAPGDQSDVRIKYKEDMEIECGNRVQGRNIHWYTYGSEEYGIDIFNYNTSEPKYTVPSNGGIFACTETYKFSVTSKEFCNSHKTFIIPPASDTHENKDNTATYVEGENVTLRCHVNLPLSYALLWIATYRNGNIKCLSSVEVENTLNISNNNLCCPFEGIYQRYNHTHSLHYLDIENMTTSQSGEYLCIVFFFDRGAHKWKRVNKTFINVTNGDTEHPGNTSEISNTIGDETLHTDGSCCQTSGSNIVPIVPIVSGTIGGLAAIGAIICLIIYIKCKGKQRRADHSYTNTVPTEYECTPYAVGVGRENTRQVEPNSGYSEIGMGSEAKPIPVYSEVDMKPPVEPSSEYSEVGMDPHTVYSKICKKSDKEIEVIQAENDSCAAYSVVELKN